MLKTYHGSCHCGAVRFEADLHFCKHCGVRCFGIGTETPIGVMYGVNLGCLEDATDAELAAAPITYVDGRNDRWGEAPEIVRHL